MYSTALQTPKFFFDSPGTTQGKVRVLVSEAQSFYDEASGTKLFDELSEQTGIQNENNQFLINTTLYVVSNKTQRFVHNFSSGVKVS